MAQHLIFFTLFIYFEELFIHMLVCVGESKVDVITMVEKEYIFSICTVQVIIIVKEQFTANELPLHDVDGEIVGGDRG